MTSPAVPCDGTGDTAGLGLVQAAVIGAVAGLAGGALGIGGGLVMVPLLTLWVGTPIKRAIGTSLLGVLSIATVGVVAERFIAPESQHWLEAALLATGAVAGSWLGVRVIARTAPPLVARLMAGLLVVAALKMTGVLAALGLATAPGGGEADLLVSPAASAAAHVLAGLGAGVVSSLFGVGGGILAVPILAFLHPAWAFQEARATSLVMIVPTALAGALFHRKLRNVDARVAASLVPAALAGVVGGVLLANSVPARPLELAFAALLLVAAVRLALRGSH